MPKGIPNKKVIEDVIDPKIVCGHEEIVHKPDCKACHSLKAFCGQRWNRCGGHGEHHENDCQTLCI